MITYEDIKRVNEGLVTVDIKGKPYIPVNERIRGFRMLYPTGYIKTEILSNVDGVVVFRAYVGYYADNGVPVLLGNGTAYEKEGSTFINRTSYIENAESSAIGRAIAIACGIGIDTSVASAEEVQNAMLNQAATDKIDKVKVQALTGRCKEEGVSADLICRLYKVKDFSELTEAQHSNIHLNWDKIKVQNSQIYDHG